MTDIPGVPNAHGTPSPRRPNTQRAIADADAVARVFSSPRPIHLRQQLPDSVLRGIPDRSPLLVQLLHNRGISGADEIGAFLAGEWRASRPNFLHLDLVVERILRAARTKEQIVVYGDFDCDGITSCALLTLTLRALDANARPYIPRRDDDGRGLNLEAVRELAEAGTRLIVTTDCGTANEDEIALARELGVDVIVTDHHPPHAPLAPAFAIVNPQQDNDLSHEKHLAGVGVAYRVAQALLAASPACAFSVSELLDLVAIGTIADVVPLTSSNWSLVRAGLRQIRQAPRPGVRALLAMARLRPEDVVARDISFAVAPRINACGRMGRPDLALEILLTSGLAEADHLSRQIEELNIQRQAITDEIILEARAQAASAVMGGAQAIVAQGDQWPVGVLGLVAGRLAEEYHQPVFVISRGETECRGSARGPVGTDLGAVLEKHPEFFRRFGGHAQAAGFTLTNEALPDFLEYLNDYFTTAGAPSRTLAGGQVQDSTPVTADCRLVLHRLESGSSVYKDLEALEPFGAGFVEPIFVCQGARIVGCRRSGVEGRTLRLRLTQGGTSREFIWSRKGDLCDTLRAALQSLPPVDVAFSLRKYRRSATGEAEWLAHIETVAPTALQ